MEGTRRTPAKKVFAITERQPKEGEARGKGWFTAVGAGWLTNDGALSITLDAMPMSGKLYVRDWDPERDGPKERKSVDHGSAELGGKDSELPF